MPTTRTLLTLVLVPLLAFLVACGDDDDDGGGGGDSSQPAASDSGGGDSSDSNGDSSDGDADSDGDNGGDSDADTAEILGNCPELLSMFGAFTSGAFAAGGSGDAEQDLQDVAEIFQNAAENAPDEIKADMQVFADTFAGLYATLEDLDVDLSDPSTFATLDAADQAELFAALEALDTAELQQASDNLDAWFAENCE